MMSDGLSKAVEDRAEVDNSNTIPESSSQSAVSAYAKTALRTVKNREELLWLARLR